MSSSRARKALYFERMTTLLDSHETILVISIDNVGSFQMATIRKQLRPLKAQVLLGKNTLQRLVIAKYCEKHPDHPSAAISEKLVGNVGLVFVTSQLDKVRDVIKANVKAAPAKVGQVSESDVIIPPGPTGCDPGQTSWFQALNVPTKISKGSIEITSAVHLIKRGIKVGASEASLLQKLNILPFTYGVKFVSVYMNGSVFDAAVLDITEEQVKQKFLAGTRMVAALSLATGIPTRASLPHSIGNAVRSLLAVSAVTGIKFKQSKPWDALLA